MILKDLVLFWAQWSWKGTQARLLEEHFLGQYRYFESGAILRALSMTDNPIGNYVKWFMDKGQMIDNGLVVALFDAFYVTLQQDQAMMVDWFPRNVPQMHSFLDRMYRNKREMLWVWIDVPKEIAIERALQRGRPDDTRESVEKRINNYYEQTMPTIDYFIHFGKLIKIDGTKTPEEVHQEIMSELRAGIKK
jgi:adenylate kinase